MFPVLEELFWFSDRGAAAFREFLIKLSSLLNLKTKFSSSSSLEILPGHNGEDKIIQTVKALSGNADNKHRMAADCIRREIPA